MCVEGGHNVDTHLTVAHLLNLNFTSVVEDATHLHGLHRPVAHKLVKLVRLGRPRELTLVRGSDISGLLAEEGLATVDLLFLFLATTALVLCSLVHEHYQRQNVKTGSLDARCRGKLTKSRSSESAEHNFLRVHVDSEFIY